MQTKLPSGLGVTADVIVVTAVIALYIDTAMNAYAQNMTTSLAAQQNQTANPEQIKNYLTPAIRALDSGNHIKEAEQVDLATDQLEGSTGTESGEDDEDVEVEEGAGEDADEPGDIDTNDEEDRP